MTETILLALLGDIKIRLSKLEKRVNKLCSHSSKKSMSEIDVGRV